MTAFFQHIHIGGDYGRKQLQQQLTLTALFTLLLVMPTLLKAQDTPDPTIQAFAPDPSLSDDMAFSDLEDRQANLTDSQSVDPATNGAPGGGGGLLDDLPPELLPSDAFASVDDIPLAPAPGIPAAPASRNRPQERITSLISLLSPPSPGSPPFDLTPEQQAAIPTYESWRKSRITVGVNRNTGNLDAQTMACGVGYLNDHFKDHWVAIPEAMYGAGELCGACVRMACVDEACKDALVRREVFMVVDKCMECQGNRLVVSAVGMQNLTGLNIDLNPTTIVAWEFVSCAPLIQGGIKMLPSSENRRNYVALNFSNSKQLLRAVAIDGIRMTPTDFGMWVIDTPEQDIPLSSPYTLQLLGRNGQLVTTQITALRPQDLGVQF